MEDTFKALEILSERVSKVFAENDALKMAINCSHEGIAILNKEGIYTYINKAHEEMFKYEKGEMLGQSWTILYSDKQIKYFTDEVFPIIAKDGKWSGRDVAICKDGSLQAERVFLTSLPDGGLICLCIKEG